MISIRSALPSELTWVNTKYTEVDFAPSSFEGELIAVAEVDGQKAGLGRLIIIDSNKFELGGMYVFDSFQGKGIAKKIVDFLLKQVSSSQIVYYIPFEHLISFYRQHGFKPCASTENVPEKVLKKLSWCHEKYPKPTCLLVYRL